MITLTLSEDEAAAVAVALVGLIHDPQGGRWSTLASVVALRLEAVRERG
jgi:hypothetical protein